MPKAGRACMPLPGYRMTENSYMTPGRAGIGLLPYKLTVKSVHCELLEHG